MSASDHKSGEHSLRADVEALADQLCHAVDGKFDFTVRVDTSDQTVQKLQMLVNFVIDAARRNIEEVRRANAHLESARVAAEAANQAKSDFLANMSHELRTPMTAIIGFAETLGEVDSEQEQASAVETIVRNGRHLLGVINDVLDLAKVEAGKLEAVTAPLEPRVLVDQLLESFQVRCAEKRIDIAARVTNRVPCRIDSDEQRLRQILMNLVSNAVKFTERGSIGIDVDLIRSRGGDRLRIDVTDTGIGIAPACAPKLFSPFSQADETTSRSFGGTGLGLTISRRMANLLGGDVTLLRSAPGEGSCFRVEVLVKPHRCTDCTHDKPRDDCGRSRTTKPMRTSITDSLEGVRVLVAEDGLDNQKLIGLLLKRAGIEYTVAGNGADAKALALEADAAGNPFDLILMDMQMPVMDGYEATRQLRAGGYAQPIIALTAHAMNGDREKCIGAGCDDYLTKPLDRQKLYDTVRRVTSPAAAATV